MREVIEDTYPGGDAVKEVDEGTWNFLGGVGRTKNKERIRFTYNSTIYSTLLSGIPGTYTIIGSDYHVLECEIQTLRNKEMVLEFNREETDNGVLIYKSKGISELRQ